MGLNISKIGFFFWGRASSSSLQCCRAYKRTPGCWTYLYQARLQSKSVFFNRSLNPACQLLCCQKPNLRTCPTSSKQAQTSKELLEISLQQKSAAVLPRLLLLLSLLLLILVGAIITIPHFFQPMICDSQR